MLIRTEDKMGAEKSFIFWPLYWNASCCR